VRKRSYGTKKSEKKKMEGDSQREQGSRIALQPSEGVGEEMNNSRETCLKLAEREEQFASTRDKGRKPHDKISGKNAWVGFRPKILY